MNLFSLLSIRLEKALRIIAKEQDKNRVCFSYIPKMDLNLDNPKVSKSIVQFSELRRSFLHNPNLFIKLPPCDAQ